MARAIQPNEGAWETKWLAIPYNGSIVVLQGIILDGDSELVFQLLTVDSQLSNEAVGSFPSEIQAILDDYSAVFTIPSELPPERACDHAIPLLPGARPVNVRPYRYPPALKAVF